MTATNAVQQKGILFDFVGDLRNEEADRSLGKPYYLVTAKGDINALREVVKALRSRGDLDERAEVFLKFLPEAKEGSKESTAYVEIPYKKALVLQRFLLGWGGSLQRLLREIAKSETTDYDGDGEPDDLSWMANINVDVSIQDWRKTYTGFWSNLWGTAHAFDQAWVGSALGVTDEEWKQIESKDPGIIGRLSHSVAQGVTQTVGEAGKALVSALQNGLKGAGIDPNKLSQDLKSTANTALEQIKKIALYTGVSLVVAALLWGILRFALRRPAVSVNVEPAQLPATTKGRR